MAYSIIPSDQLPGRFARIDNIDDKQRWPAGYKVRALDPVFGYAEFVYLAGLPSTAVGELVKYNESGAATRATAGTRGRCAVAMTANIVATSWSWYQVYGLGVIRAGTVAADAPVYATATAGTVDDAVVAGDKVSGAVFETANAAGATTVGGLPSTGSQPSYTVAAGTALVGLAYPCMDGDG